MHGAGRAGCPTPAALGATSCIYGAKWAPWSCDAGMAAERREEVDRVNEEGRRAKAATLGNVANCQVLRPTTTRSTGPMSAGSSEAPASSTCRGARGLGAEGVTVDTARFAHGPWLEADVTCRD